MTPLILKLLVAVLGLAMGYYLIMAIYRNHHLVREHRLGLFKGYRRNILGLSITSLLLLIAVGIMRVSTLAQPVSQTLLEVHVGFATLLLIIVIVMQCFFIGDEKLRAQLGLLYAALVCLAVVGPTGFWMLYQA